MNYFILIFSLFLAGCVPAPKSDTPVKSGVKQSVEFLPLINGDADLHDELTEEIALEMARLGSPKAALDVLSKMSTPLRIATLYRLAILSQKAGDLGSGRRAFEAAEMGMKLYPLNPPRVPDIERASAYVLFKSPKAAEMQISKLGNHYDKNEAMSKVRADELLKASDPFALSDAPLIVPEVASAWCTLAVRAGPQKAKPFMDKALAIARDGFPIFRPRMLIECARAQAKLGDVQACRAVLMEASAVASFLGDRTESAAIEPARVGIAMAQAGMRDTARAVLDEAAVASRLCASYFQPPAMVMVAEGWWELGEKEKANSMWLEAAKVALVHPHPNARAVNAIYVLLSISKYQPEIFPELAAILDRIKRGEGGEGSVNLTLSPEIQDAISKTQKALNKSALEKDKQNAVKNTPKDSKTKKQK
jgi:hypothetical protein